MGRYYSTFITGFEDVVVKALKEKIKDLNVELVLDGLVVYETDKNYKKLLNQRYLNNTFLLLNIRINDENLTLSLYLGKFCEGFSELSPIPNSLLKNINSFRVIISDENETVRTEEDLLEETEQVLSKILRLRLDKAKPDTEVWFLKRNEGYLLTGLRLTKKQNHEKVLHKGELRPELANIMCLIAELKRTDTILDPFAGYGSIPFECLNSFQVKKIFAGEKDKRVFKILSERLSKISEKVVVGRWDGLNLSSLTDGSINRIITDPPWGHYNSKDINIEDFYRKMFKEFKRLLKKGSAIVLLSSQKELVEKIIEDSEFSLEEKYNTLVSGKKASVFRILA